MPSQTNQEIQLLVEQAFSKKHIKDVVLGELKQDPMVQIKIDQGVELIKNWCESESAYESKQVRKDHISQMDLPELVTDVFTKVASLTSQTTLNNMASQMAPMLGFDDTRVGITACAEIIAVLCDTDFFNLNKPHIQSSIYIESLFQLSDETIAYIERACYLPPLIVKPNTLHNNRSSGYKTIKGESLILGGSHNHHSDDIALDVLNIMNRYALTINGDVVTNIKEEPTSDLNEVEDAHLLTEIELQRAIAQQHKNWNRHIEQSQYFYHHIQDNGNKMYITNKVDKRGRIYSQGHHINPQGTSYKKCLIDLYNQETIEVPNDFFN